MIRKLVLTFAFAFAGSIAAAAIEIKEVTSPGGIEAWMVEDPSIPFAALVIRFGVVHHWMRPSVAVIDDGAD